MKEELLRRGERIVIPEGQHKKDGAYEEGNTYLLTNPGIVEAPDIDHSTVVPRTGGDHSTPIPLIDTNLLYAQHQYEDEGSGHIDKTAQKERHTGRGQLPDQHQLVDEVYYGQGTRQGTIRARDQARDQPSTAPAPKQQEPCHD